MKRRTFTAVVTAHADDPNPMISQLLSQTRRPDEILVYISDKPEDVDLALIEDIPGVKVFVVPNRNDWGHEKRAMGLAAASSDYVGFFNADDEYVRIYIERMMEAAERGKLGVVYCEWVGRDRPYGLTKFRTHSSTAGNWIGRTALLRTAGYTSRDYAADGVFIERVRSLRPTVGRINDILYQHN